MNLQIRWLRKNLDECARSGNSFPAAATRFPNLFVSNSRVPRFRGSSHRMRHSESGQVSFGCGNAMELLAPPGRIFRFPGVRRPWCGSRQVHVSGRFCSAWWCEAPAQVISASPVRQHGAQSTSCAGGSAVSDSLLWPLNAGPAADAGGACCPNCAAD